MSSEIILANLLNYNWQLVTVVGLGMALPILFRLREPRSQLVYLQALLAVALLLPALEPWVQPVAFTFGSLLRSSCARIPSIPRWRSRGVSKVRSC